MKRSMLKRHHAFTLTDLLVVMVLLPVVGVAFLGCRDRQGIVAGGAACASNLRQIGQAIFMYSTANGGAFPRTTYDMATADKPIWGTGATASNPFGAEGPAPNDVTAAMFLLLRTQPIGPAVFNCPSMPQRADGYGGNAGGAMGRSNFSNLSINLSYGYMNPYPDELAVGRGFSVSASTSSPEFAVAADRGPSLDAVPELATITTSSRTALKRKSNSPNHKGEGQNVLYGDGHVDFQNNPLVGVRNDNIYTRSAVDAKGYIASDGSSDQASPISAPATANDSVILPLAP